MNEDHLLAHYERIADAPDAIARLRRFILDLAVRGKLVPQDPNDEPASELLKRIVAEKARLVKAGEIRKPPLLEAISHAETPCALPSGWVWVRIGDIFDYDAGTKRDPKELLQDRWLLELEDIEKDTSTVLERLRVRDRDSLSTKSEFEVGDVLYGKLRPYLNKVVVADEPGYSTTEIVVIRPFLKLCPQYCALAFRRPDFVAYVERLGRGTKMPRLRTPDAIVAAFPLPPLAEQHRIVAKVDELMALCDRLEAARAERERMRDRLTAASLARLNAPDPDTFRDDARFALDALPVLTTRHDQIKHLRQTILNLAVRGKLVSQDLGDEPATELLKRIAKEKANLIKSGIAKREKPTTLETVPFELPTTWTWCAFGQLSQLITKGSSPKWQGLVAALVAEHAPLGPTEEHLVEELAGILWRKRRLRLAEAAAHRRGLEGTFASYKETAKVALVHLDATDQSERVVDAIRATAADTEDDIREMQDDEAMTRRALDLLGSRRNDPYEAALAALREDTRAWWADTLARDPDELEEDEQPATADVEGLRRFLEGEVLPWFDNRKKELVNRPLIREQAFGEALDPDKLERLGRYEVHLDRKLERMLAMLLRLKDLRQETVGP